MCCALIARYPMSMNVQVRVDPKTMALLKLAQAKKEALAVGAIREMTPEEKGARAAAAVAGPDTIKHVSADVPAAIENAAPRWTAPDGVGFVELLDTFGDDLTVVNAARVSFAKESVEMCERDAKLIGYLAEHNHVTPFFHPQARFRIKMPIFVAREWYRHQIGFARNEVSRRYVDSEPECWLPAVEDLRARDPKAKQGSRVDPVAEAAWWQARVRQDYERSLGLYDEMIKGGVAPEVARVVLPQSMYTEFIETGSLAAYARLCGLRTTPDAQREIQAYANGLSTLLSPRFPVSWPALSRER
jgi:thymidylate synthase (FAD)